MKERKFKVKVLEDGRIVIEDLPLAEGQEVEVTLRLVDPQKPPYPLRGLPLRIKNPFEPVAESDWESRE